MPRFTMGFKLFLVFVFCTGVKAQQNPLQHCLDILQFENGIHSFIKVAAEKEVEETCSKMREFNTCINNVARQKFGFDVKEIASLTNGTEPGKGFQLIANMMDLTEELCTDGTQLHEDYLVDVQCLRLMHVEAQEKCQRESVAASVLFRHLDTEESFDHDIDEPCVITAYNIACLGATISEECGNHAFNTYKEIVKKVDFFKLGICPTDIIHTVNATIVNILEKEECRRPKYHIILDLKERRK